MADPDETLEHEVAVMLQRATEGRRVRPIERRYVAPDGLEPVAVGPAAPSVWEEALRHAEAEVHRALCGSAPPLR